MSDEIKTSIIVAMADNHCIGKDNQMPWHISDDLKRFKALTMDHPVIMGRKTFESILGYLNKPLPGRENIVITRSEYETPHDAHIHNSLQDAISKAKEIAQAHNRDEIFIIGGAQIYTQAMDYAQRLHLTKVHKSVEGDAFFPEYNADDWREVNREDHMEHDPPFSFITLERR
ncbi:MAG: dihydrofolate reductase [Alcanivorax sp.]